MRWRVVEEAPKVDIGTLAGVARIDAFLSYRQMVEQPRKKMNCSGNSFVSQS
jgi:hypothetical protein